MKKIIILLFIGLFSISVYANNKQYETKTPIAKKNGGKRVSKLVSL